MRPLAGRVALVTGGSRGIGRATAVALATDGAAVAIGYRSDALAAEEAVAEVVAAGGTAVAIRADLSDADEVGRLYREVLDLHGRLDVVVNNAGHLERGLLRDVTPEQYERVVGANMRGTFLSLQRASVDVVDGGRIVNVSSCATVRGGADSGVYMASKAAVEQFTRALARELGPRGVTVNTVSPAWTATDMMRDAESPETLEEAIAQTPLGRLGTPADIADVIRLVVDDRARWITGQTIRADGGWTS